MGLAGFTPVHLDEALEYLQQYGDQTRILAGGTDLLVRHHGNLDELQRILNICELDELKSIKIVDSQIEIGSLVTHNQLEESAIIQKYVSFLAEAAGAVGAPQIRNRGTIGGNIANASPAGDTLPPLIALDAKVKLCSRNRGEVIVPLTEFLIGPGQNLAKKDELITGITFSIPHHKDQGVFLKLDQRKALTIAVVNVAVMLRLAGDMVQDCRIVLGAVAPTPVRVQKTEECLQGKSITEAVISEAIQFLGQEIAPIDDIRGSCQYRYETARQLVEQGIRMSWQRGGRRSE